MWKKMQASISSPNFLFLLAYAFDLRWDYLEKDVQEEKTSDLSYFELLTFVLAKWTEGLIKEGLYRTFINKVEQTRRVRGRILFEPNVKSGGLFSDRLWCQFDDLSFDTLENQILLSTLQFCSQELGRKKRGLTSGRKKTREDLDLSLWKLIRLLSSQVSFIPSSSRLFDKLLFHRMNIKYKPVLTVCQFIYDCAILKDRGRDLFFDIPENKMNEIFERFLRNYLAEQLFDTGFRVDKKGSSGWVVSEEDQKTLHFPSIRPDIVVWERDVPCLIIDAKFYKNPVYKVEPWYSDRVDEEEPVVYKTHSHNLYQLITYTDFYNCDGLLVYVQTETGHFQEMGRINPKHYPNQNLCYRSFGFRTLDLSGELERFKERMENFAEEITNFAQICKEKLKGGKKIDLKIKKL